jgi:uncharacterized protein YegP (UPF0339 family)
MVWAFAYDNGFDREIERFASRQDCEAAIREIKATSPETAHD